MATVKLLLKMDKLNDDGLAPLYIRIIKNRKTKYISLGQYIKPEHWNVKDSSVKKGHPNSARLNAFLKTKIAEATNVALELETKSKNVNTEEIKEKILGKASSSFFDYADAYLTKLEQRGAYGTYKRAKTVVNKLRDYTAGKTLLFDDLTVTFMKGYEHYLAKEMNNKVNTVDSNFRILRKIINDAINEDFMSRDDNPFNKLQMKTEPTNRAYLTEDELNAFENLDLDETSMIFHHRNMYVFAAYTGGLRISDILQLTWSNFDGKKINLFVHKTKTPLSIMVPSKALNIIDHYKTIELAANNNVLDSTKYIFPVLKVYEKDTSGKEFHGSISSATAYTNKDLKTIAKKAGVHKLISFHTSRHTWATRALRKGMRIEYVSKLMGHSRIPITQVYTKIVNEELDKAMDIFNE